MLSGTAQDLDDLHLFMSNLRSKPWLQTNTLHPDQREGRKAHVPVSLERPRGGVRAALTGGAPALTSPSTKTRMAEASPEVITRSASISGGQLVHRLAARVGDAAELVPEGVLHRHAGAVAAERQGPLAGAGGHSPSRVAVEALFLGLAFRGLGLPLGLRAAELRGIGVGLPLRRPAPSPCGP
jgi:hypothetical protein